MKGVIQKSVNFDYKMLSHLLAVKRNEDWSLPECCYVVELITKDWDLPRIVQFFGHFFRTEVDISKQSKASYTDNAANIKTHSLESKKWSCRDLGHLIGNSMYLHDYPFIVTLLIRLVTGESNYHEPILDHVPKYVIYNQYVLFYVLYQSKMSYFSKISRYSPPLPPPHLLF